jgi:HK97 family phage major capsid protein
MKVQIKKLYDEANTLYQQAQAILKEFEGKEIPKEKTGEMDKLLDQVEAKTEEAKRLERLVAADALLNDPATRLPTPQAGQGAGAADPERTKAQKTALNKFFRHGTQSLNGDEIKLLAEGGFQAVGSEVKALAADDFTAGGALLSTQFRAELLTKQREVQAMRRISRVLPPIPGGSSVTPTQDSDLSDATWTSEISTGSLDTVKPFGGRILTPHPLAKGIRVSNTLLRASGFDVEAWVRDNLAYKFSVPEENGFINGPGSQQALGLLSTITAIPTYTTVTSNELHGDDVINWAYTLPARYSPNARVLCNRAFIRKVRALHTFATTVNAQTYLWMPGLGPGLPNKILDWPYELSDRYDDGVDGSDVFEDNAVVAVIGDFNYYWIVDSLNLSIQRVVELYAATNETGFFGRKETDGMAALAEAFMGLKIKA